MGLLTDIANGVSSYWDAASTAVTSTDLWKDVSSAVDVVKGSGVYDAAKTGADVYDAAKGSGMLSSGGSKRQRSSPYRSSTETRQISKSTHGSSAMGKAAGAQKAQWAGSGNDLGSAWGAAMKGASQGTKVATRSRRETNK